MIRIQLYDVLVLPVMFLDIGEKQAETFVDARHVLTRRCCENWLIRQVDTRQSRLRSLDAVGKRGARLHGKRHRRRARRPRMHVRKMQKYELIAWCESLQTPDRPAHAL